MENTNQIVKEIKERETLKQYIERYTDEELQRICRDPEESVKFCSKLLSISAEEFVSPFRTTPELEKLWDAVKNLNNYGRLRHFVKMLKPVRDDLVKTLDANAGYIEQYVAIGMFTQLTACVVDIAGTVGNLFLGDSDTNYSKWALTADVSGYLGDIAPMLETYFTYNAYDEAEKKLRKDHQLLSPIYDWFQQTKELEVAIRNIFPFDERERLLEMFYAAASREFRGVRLLANILEKIAIDSVHHLRDGVFLQNLLCLITSSLIEEVIELLKVQREHSDQSFFQNMYGRLSFESFLKLGMHHKIATQLPSKHQKSSGVVFLHIGWNVFSILQILKNFRNIKLGLSETAKEMRQLKEHLSDEMDTLERVTGYIERRMNEE